MAFLYWYYLPLTPAVQCFSENFAAPPVPYPLAFPPALNADADIDDR
jgi:hypothetical protein